MNLFIRWDEKIPALSPSLFFEKNSPTSKYAELEERKIQSCPPELNIAGRANSQNHSQRVFLRDEEKMDNTNLLLDGVSSVMLAL